MGSLFNELKRRNVFRVGGAYAVVSWLTLQVTESIVPIIEAPVWVTKIVLILLVVGFPIALLFAWAFELTPEGIKKTTEVAGENSTPHTTGRKINFVVIGALILIIGGLIYQGKFTSSQNLGTTIDVTENNKSVAVLPFVNMSDDSEQEWFSDGLTEEILNSLAALPELQVTARTSAFFFKDKDLPIQKIASQLGVAHVVEGSVRRQGDTLRITAQLIRAVDGFHLWSQTYDRPYKDTFEVQRDVAEKIAETLDVVLDDERREIMFSSGTTNLEAFEYYQKGLVIDEAVHGRRMPDKTLWDANALFDKAIAADPHFAAAYYATQDAYAHSLEANDPLVVLAGTTQPIVTPERALEKMAEIMDLAIKYAKNDAAKTAYQMEKAYYSDNWSVMALLLNKIRKNPGLYATQGTDLNEILFALGEIEALDAATKQMMRVNPLHTLNRGARSAYLFVSGNCPAMIELGTETRQLLGSSNTTPTELYCYLRDNNVAAIRKWLDDNYEIIGNEYRDLAQYIVGDIDSIPPEKIMNYQYTVQLFYWKTRGDQASINAAASLWDADKYIGVDMMSGIGRRFGFPLPFEMKYVPNHVRHLRQAGLSEEKIQSMFLPSSDESK